MKCQYLLRKVKGAYQSEELLGSNLRQGYSEVRMRIGLVFTLKASETIDFIQLSVREQSVGQMEAAMILRPR